MTNTLMNRLHALYKDESGQGLVEYGAALALSAVLLGVGYKCISGGGFLWTADLATALHQMFDDCSHAMARIHQAQTTF